ncbi:hypothetical protein ASE04_04180 [Rhizobium sp. Root708]|uniref:hypothetical protein n=1 Tax=Rhizobium sp. Root708 TaxID=1736592 RepID=UPI00070065F2|nr:hypothetical protein [Rhizobium sp. Root708]KRB58900.1 hypothetical protein ASE04_04180 [Rhizobium sp. Root708]
MEREVYQQQKNGIEQQFAQHNLEKDMAADYAAAFSKVDDGAQVRELNSVNRALLVFLAVVLIGFAVLVAVY